jgi:hypothetical protein
MRKKQLVRNFFRRFKRFHELGLLAKRLITKIRRVQPFTPRAAMLILLSVIAIKQFGLPESDLIALTLGGAVLGITLFCLVYSLRLRLLLGKKLTADLFFDRENLYSKKEIPSGIVLKQSNLPPFFALKIVRTFEHSGAKSSVHIVKGSVGESGARHLIDSVSFSHRGNWVISSIVLTIQDVFGLVSFSWEIPVNYAIEISAPEIPIEPLPIVAASARAGEELSLTQLRSGDLYDLRQYDPSDGTRRILWKTYAKRRELIVRRPEPAIIPEGEVAVFLVAGSNEDFVVGGFVSYLRLLERQDVTILFGTDGLYGATHHVNKNSKTSATENQLILTDSSRIQTAVNHAVWSPQVGTGSDFLNFINALMKRNQMIERVIVFVSDQNSAAANKIMHATKDLSVQVTFALMPARLAQNPHQNPLNKFSENMFNEYWQALNKKFSPSRSQSHRQKPEIFTTLPAEQVLQCKSQENFL